MCTLCMSPTLEVGANKSYHMLQRRIVMAQWHRMHIYNRCCYIHIAVMLTKYKSILYHACSYPITWHKQLFSCILEHSSLWNFKYLTPWLSPKGLEYCTVTRRYNSFSSTFIKSQFKFHHNINPRGKWQPDHQQHHHGNMSIAQACMGLIWRPSTTLSHRSG